MKHFLAAFDEALAEFQQLHHFTFSLAGYKDSDFSTFLPTVVIM